MYDTMHLQRGAVIDETSQAKTQLAPARRIVYLMVAPSAMSANMHVAEITCVVPMDPDEQRGT